MLLSKPASRLADFILNFIDFCAVVTLGETEISRFDFSAEFMRVYASERYGLKNILKKSYPFIPFMKTRVSERFRSAVRKTGRAGFRPTWLSSLTNVLLCGSGGWHKHAFLLKYSLGKIR